MWRLPSDVSDARGRCLSQTVARSNHAGSGSDEVSEMKSADSTMSYFELLKLVSPETIVVITALAVLTFGLAAGRGKSSVTISTAKPAQSGSDTSTATGICSVIGAFGRSGTEIFPVRQHIQRFYAFRNQPDLRCVGYDQSRGDFGEIGLRLSPAVAGDWDCDDARRFRVQNCRGTISSVGAGRLPG